MNSENVKYSYYCLHFSQLSTRELYEITALRESVFVVEQDCPYLDADGLDPDAHHLMAYDESGKLQAYARLLPPGSSYPDHASLGRVITAPAARNKGLGRALMEKSLEWMEKLYGKKPIKISAQTYLIRFYESLGFQTVGGQYLEDGIPHIAMARQPIPAK